MNDTQETSYIVSRMRIMNWCYYFFTMYDPEDNVRFKKGYGKEKNSCADTGEKVRESAL